MNILSDPPPLIPLPNKIRPNLIREGERGGGLYESSACTVMTGGEKYRLMIIAAILNSQSEFHDHLR